jgi:hypothetical protein
MNVAQLRAFLGSTRVLSVRSQNIKTDRILNSLNREVFQKEESTELRSVVAIVVRGFIQDVSVELNIDLMPDYYFATENVDLSQMDRKDQHIS